jgi:hypothetical protein
MSKQKPVSGLFRTKLVEKLEEYGKAVANYDVCEYIFFLTTKRRKHSNDLKNDLLAFFGEQTEEFVDWIRSTLYDNEKRIKCKFYPNCSDMNCQFFHPVKKVGFK